jgi:hypothetical protein
VPWGFLIGNVIVSCLFAGVVLDVCRRRPARKSDRKATVPAGVRKSCLGLSKTQKRKNSACDIFLLGKEKETHFAHMRGGIDLPGSGIDLPGKSIPRGIEIPGNLIPHPARRIA